MGIAEGFEEFVAVVDHGSLTAAARALGLPRATLSRRLARLEEDLGVRLLHRTTRRVRLSREGEALYGKARYVVDTARAARDEVARLDGEPRGVLRVSTPTEMPPRLLAGWMRDFLRAHPHVQVELVASSAHVDLVRDGIDVVLRGGPIDDPSLVIRTLAYDLRIAVASPAYLERCGHPRTPQDLADHDCILGYARGLEPERRWPLRDGGVVEVHGPLAMNQMGQRLHAAIAGVGIAMVVNRIAADALAAGELVTVLPDVVGRADRLCLAYADRTFLDPKIRAFVDFMADRIAEVRAEVRGEGATEPTR